MKPFNSRASKPMPKISFEALAILSFAFSIHRKTCIGRHTEQCLQFLHCLRFFFFGSGSTFGGLGADAPPPPPPYGGQSGAPIFGGQSETSGFGAQSSFLGQPTSVFGEKKSSTDQRTVFESVASTATPTQLFKR